MKLEREKIDTAASDDDGRPDFAAGQIREWNRQQNDVIS
jgi:hypothetical protein